MPLELWPHAQFEHAGDMMMRCTPAKGGASMPPRTIDQAVRALMASIPNRSLHQWACLPRHEARQAAHFGLGMRIRDEWIRAGEAPLIARIRKAAPSLRDDEASEMIVLALYRVANWDPCPTIEELVKELKWRRRNPPCPHRGHCVPNSGRRRRRRGRAAGRRSCGTGVRTTYGAWVRRERAVREDRQA